MTVQTQGEETGARIAVTFRSSRTCLLSSRASLTDLVDRRIAHVEDNPLDLHVSGVLRPGHYWSLLAFWSNWCGARSGISYLARFGTHAVRGRFNTLPVCLQPRGSKLLAARRESG